MGPRPSKDGRGHQGRLRRSPHMLGLDEPYERVQELVFFVTLSVESLILLHVFHLNEIFQFFAK